MLERIRAAYRRVRPYQLSGADPALARRTQELMLALREETPPSWG
jgi:hypothetical protein